MRLILDIEATGLLDETSLDYTSMPYRLKPDFRLWCVVCRDIDTGVISVFTEENMGDLRGFLSKAKAIIGHHILRYDLPVLALATGLSYKVGQIGETDIIEGNPCRLYDTVILSKLTAFDIVVNHSLKEWGKFLGCEKIEFDDWTALSEEMVDYCIADTMVNLRLWQYLQTEMKNPIWAIPYQAEKRLAHVTHLQEFFGFGFNVELALKNREELECLMHDIAVVVNPLIPDKQLNMGELKAFIPPNVQIKKDGSVTAVMERWLERMDAEQLDEHVYEIYGESYTLPIPLDPIKTTGDGSIEDLQHIKKFLLGLGWNPIEYKERDLGFNQKLKRRATVDEYQATVHRYVKQTTNGLFEDFRCRIIGKSPEMLQDHLMQQDPNKPVRVPTSPSLTIGLEKEICPNLLAMAEKFPETLGVVQYYTYKHRRNSICGGKTWDEEEDVNVGFLSRNRIYVDGRINTPADTLGANTGRYTHKVVANIPRVTSLYGGPQRALFQANRSAGHFQFGYDFASLEAVVQGHFCLPYTDGVLLAEALVAKKPNDIHTLNAIKLGIDRNAAKSFGYASLYGAQPAKLAKMLGVSTDSAKTLFNAYWESVPALYELKTQLERHWEKNGKKWIAGIDGRKLFSRSKHSLLNLLFQSAGALIVKYTTLRIQQKLDEHNLLFNVFDDDVYAQPSVNQMIIYHDEGQYSIHKSLVTINGFDTEEEAESAITPESSAVSHIGDKFFVSTAPLMYKIIKESIEETTAFLNFRLHLGFEYKIGRNWRDTH